MKIQNFEVVKLDLPGGKKIFVNPRNIEVEDFMGMVTLTLPSGKVYSFARHTPPARTVLAILESHQISLSGDNEPEPKSDPAPETDSPGPGKHASLKTPPLSADLKSSVRQILDENWIDKRSGYFAVASPDATGRLLEHRVERKESDGRSKVVCDCWTFISESVKDPNFRCDHILALKEFLLRQNEPEAVTTVELPAQASAKIEHIGGKWICHHRTQQRIQILIGKILIHPARDVKTDQESIFAQIRWKTGNKSAPEKMSQETAETIEKWLEKWLADLDAKKEELKAPRAA